METSSWHLYILLCGDGSFYTGITNNLGRRTEQHASGKGAKYTRSRGVAKLVYSEVHKTHHAAAVREFEVKKLTHAGKVKLVRAKANANAKSKAKAQL